jgi:uncharacterized coiled-coil protein SlyX
MADRSNWIKTLTATLPILAIMLASSAYAEIWECMDKVSGTKRYTNIKSEAHGCRAMNFEPINTPPPHHPTTQRTANFPSVDDDTQKQRDADRRRILDMELAQEEQLLDEAKKQLAEQEAVRNGDERNYARVVERLEPYQHAVRLHEDNVTSLKKEIGSSK